MSINLVDFNLLIVDDDEGLRETLFELFSGEGATVFTASNGEEALQISLVEKIDLILSDIKMPVMDGMDLLKSIGDSDHKIPFVWLMSGESELTEEAAIALGAQGLLNKPFKLMDVLKAVSISLEQRGL
jgi:CheY-like chemotaxis protein